VNYLKSTGVTRKIDELGRIVIPKEIRKNLGIRDGESLEIFIDNESIILKKYEEISKYETYSINLCNLISNIYEVDVIITNREKIVACNNSNIINKRLENRLINLIDNRETFNQDKEVSFTFGDTSLAGFYNILPIIVESDSIGLVIIRSDKNNNYTKLIRLINNILTQV
jgi:stage V sporulation protein T